MDTKEAIINEESVNPHFKRPQEFGLTLESNVKAESGIYSHDAGIPTYHDPEALASLKTVKSTL